MQKPGWNMCWVSIRIIRAQPKNIRN
jgi:hypothetical protein